MSDPDFHTSLPVLAGLARRAAAEPYNPWLFFRHSLDWEWRSWSQVTDQITRGVRNATATESPRIAFENRLDPDDLAAGLAILATGKTAVAVSGSPPPGLPFVKTATDLEDSAAADSGDAFLSLPACRDHLDRQRHETIVSAATLGNLEASPESQPIPMAELSAGSSRLAALLPEAPPSRISRQILCATPELEADRVLALLAWTVHRAAVWALEPASEAFQATLLWTRPTVVVATAKDLDSIAVKLSSRPHRRHHRLQIAITIDEMPKDLQMWSDLGVALRRWPRA